MIQSEDRNADGRIDREVHKYPELADADWELRDEDYDGVYEQLITYGYAVQTQQVSIAVPLQGMPNQSIDENGEHALPVRE